MKTEENKTTTTPVVVAQVEKAEKKTAKLGRPIKVTGNPQKDAKNARLREKYALDKAKKEQGVIVIAPPKPVVVAASVTTNSKRGYLRAETRELALQPLDLSSKSKELIDEKIELYIKNSNLVKAPYSLEEEWKQDISQCSVEELIYLFDQGFDFNSVKLETTAKLSNTKFQVILRLGYKCGINCANNALVLSLLKETTNTEAVAILNNFSHLLRLSVLSLYDEDLLEIAYQAKNAQAMLWLLHKGYQGSTHNNSYYWLASHVMGLVDTSYINFDSIQNIINSDFEYDIKKMCIEYLCAQPDSNFAEFNLEDLKLLRKQAKTCKLTGIAISSLKRKKLIVNYSNLDNLDDDLVAILVSCANVSYAEVIALPFNTFKIFIDEKYDWGGAIVNNSMKK